MPSEPHDLQKVFVGDNGSASVGLKWQRPQSGTASYYRVEVATSPFFVADGKVIERDQLVATEFGASDFDREFTSGVCERQQQLGKPVTGVTRESSL